MSEDFGTIDAVRRRPGMYVGNVHDGTALLHMAFEVVGNAIDQHRAGWARHLDVRLDGDWIEVEDDGSGFPIEPRLDGVSFLERALSSLHHGPTLDGHFPHVHVTANVRGVGLAAVQAVSSRFVVESFRGGRAWHIAFEDGRLVEPLSDRGGTARAGTRVRFRADPKLCAVTRVDPRSLRDRLAPLAYLHPHLCVRLDGRELPGRGGIAEWVRALAGELDDGILLVGEAARDDAVARVALGWRAPEHAELVRSYVSAAETRDGGTHTEGLRAGLAEGASGPASPVQVDTLARGLVAVVDVSLDNPTFSSPTMDRLKSPMGSVVAKAATFAAFTHLPDVKKARVAALLRRRLALG